MNEAVFEKLFWDAVKSEKSRSENISYLDLGGNSLGIFTFTEGVKTELGLSIPPEALLEDDATLKNLKARFLEA